MTPPTDPTPTDSIPTVAALEHPELTAHPVPVPDAATALAAVTRRGRRRREAQADLEDAIRTAAAAGNPERRITEASGLANMTVRRLLGKVHTTRTTTHPTPPADTPEDAS